MIETITQDPVSGRARLIAILGSLVLFVVVAYFIRRKQLKTGYSILWFLTVALILAISISEKVLFTFSNIVGIYYAPSLVFSVLIVIIILTLLHFSLHITKQQTQIKKLAQDNALISEKLNKIGENKKR